MNSELEFLRLYKDRLVPALHSLEPLRRAALSAFLQSVSLMLAGIPGLLMYFRYGKPAGLVWALALAAIGAYGLFGFDRKKKDYAAAFKNEVIRELVVLIDPNLQYFPDMRIAESDYRNSDLFRSPIDRYAGDDLVEGRLGATRCRFSELEHQEKRESVDAKGRRRTHWVTIFKGIFFIADFNKHFHGRTYVVPDAGFHFFGIGKLLENWNQDRGERVELENPEFEKLFTVYGTDQVEARYILSTTLMERLVQFRRKVDAPIHLSFIHDNLFLAIPLRRNLFEPNLFSTGVKFGYLKSYFSYFELVTGVIDDLNLNLRIWGKN